MVTVARLEWRKFESRSPAAVREEFERWKQPEHVWLHLDHIPIIDEDDLEEMSTSAGSTCCVPCPIRYWLGL